MSSIGLIEFTSGELPWWLPTLSTCLTNVAVTSGILALVVAAFPGLRPQRIAGQHPARSSWPMSHARTLRVATIFSVAIFASLPGWVYWRMRHPTPIPHVAVPKPNGYTTLQEASRRLHGSKLDFPNLLSDALVRQEVAKHRQALDLARVGLAQECIKPTQYSNDLNADELSGMRTLARALAAEGRVAELDANYGDAARCYTRVVRLGLSVGRKGLMIDGLVGKAIEDIGLHSLRKISDKLSLAESREAIGVLSGVNEAWEPASEFVRRDLIWTEHAGGWQGRFEVALQELNVVEQQNQQPYQSFGKALQLGQSLRRLLMVELALQAYTVEASQPPAGLAELVPSFLAEVPHDPFANRPAVGRREANALIVYSIGPDGVDDGGRPLSVKDFPWQQSTGDLRLDSFFDQEEDAAAKFEPK
jgi:hypothetical protein